MNYDNLIRFSDTEAAEIQKLNVVNASAQELKERMIQRVWEAIDASEGSELVGDTAAFDGATGVYDDTTEVVGMNNAEIRSIELSATFGNQNNFPAKDEVSLEKNIIPFNRIVKQLGLLAVKIYRNSEIMPHTGIEERVKHINTTDPATLPANKDILSMPAISTIIKHVN